MELTTQSIADGIRYAVKRGAHIINLSLGGRDDSQVLREAIEFAEQNRVVCVCAAGNDGTDNDIDAHYPASYGAPPYGLQNIIAVASINRNGVLSAFSNYGLSSVHIAAPGEDIVSTMPMNSTQALVEKELTTKYGTISGTSMAAPHVTGALALILGNVAAARLKQSNYKGTYDDYLDPLAARNVLLANGRKLESLRTKTITGRTLDIRFNRSLRKLSAFDR